MSWQITQHLAGKLASCQQSQQTNWIIPSTVLYTKEHRQMQTVQCALSWWVGRTHHGAQPSLEDFVALEDKKQSG